ATISICGTTAPSGYTRNTTYTDCYDGNANAYVGSSSVGGYSRGDGSFDYNCDGQETKVQYDRCNAYWYSGYVLSGGCNPGGSLLMCGTHSVVTPPEACGSTLGSNQGSFVGTGIYWKDASCSSSPESQVGAYDRVLCY
ncbi:MAG: hypothetical protein NUV73_02195, partial [Candidatus Daviesbacteria bacterium]|nr:hypothetical protein [Candidatus Daviesbacteria bacterium]